MEEEEESKTLEIKPGEPTTLTWGTAWDTVSWDRTIPNTVSTHAVSWDTTASTEHTEQLEKRIQELEEVVKHDKDKYKELEDKIKAWGIIIERILKEK